MSDNWCYVVPPSSLLPISSICSIYSDHPKMIKYEIDTWPKSDINMIYDINLVPQ